MASTPNSPGQQRHRKTERQRRARWRRYEAMGATYECRYCAAKLLTEGGRRSHEAWCDGP